MARRFTKQQRQEIIREFCLRRNSEFDARLFEQEVRETGPAHKAHEWFTWDESRAALEHRLWQAREFANGLKVRFTVEEISRGKVSVREVEMPMLISPLEGRQQGGGYFLSDPDDPVHMAEFCLQAATDLERWLNRYRAAIIHSGGSVAAIEKQLMSLQQAAPQEVGEAA